METMRGHSAGMGVSQHITATQSAASSGAGGSILPTIAAGLGVGYAVTFALMCATHTWLFDSAGHPPAMDFTEFWSAGRLALQGHALSAYDPRIEHAAEVAAVGHPFSTVIGWFYPPVFFFVAIGLASFSASTAFVVWTSANLVLHAAAVAGIVKRRGVFFVATAAPWAMLCNTIGQDGLLTAAIIGAVLMALPKRQILGGILLGLLCYKPQFGVLFPVALAFGGYWRAFLSAAASVTFLIFVSAAVFGFATLPAFVHGVAEANATHLVTNAAGVWFALQSVYGLARSLGASYGLAIGLQMALAISCGIGLALLWRNRIVCYSNKAAALCVATLLVTPYVWVYDMPVLSVAIAFLARERPLGRIAWCATIVAMLLVGSHPFVRTIPLLGGAYPVGLLASATVGALVLRRILETGAVPSLVSKTPGPPPRSVDVLSGKTVARVLEKSRLLAGPRSQITGT